MVQFPGSHHEQLPEARYFLYQSQCLQEGEHRDQLPWQLPGTQIFSEPCKLNAFKNMNQGSVPYSVVILPGCSQRQIYFQYEV
jgi:hypothetical protein